MVYKQSMTSEFFIKWFESQLLPSLDRPHIVIMDNASFHPKTRIDELCLASRHIFLPLPPYSPDLNPIEQAWANLKKKVVDLLPQYQSVIACLNSVFLKWNDYKIVGWQYYFLPYRFN